MSNLLSIETATRVCSVALSVDGKVAALRESSEKNVHSSVITLFIDEVMREAGLALSGLDAVCVSKGPGSYTGLRIGVSTAKGICYALDKPLIAVGTLEALAWGAKRQVEGSGQAGPHDLFCPMIDARRMEVYYSLFDMEMNAIKETAAEVLHENSFDALWAEHTLWFTGDGAEKFRELFDHRERARFIERPMPSATYLVGPAERKFAAGQFEDTAYFEPFYLKDFIPGIPKVKGLK